MKKIIKKMKKKEALTYEEIKYAVDNYVSGSISDKLMAQFIMHIYNNSFSLTEKANLIERFYPDDEIKHSILKEIEWSIIKKLNLKEYNNNFDEIYELDFNDIPFNIVKKIELCKYIKSILPESIIKKYINNE